MGSRKRNSRPEKERIRMGAVKRKSAAGTEKTRQDYRMYALTGKEKLRDILLYLLLDACVSYLFFCSWKAFVILLPGAAVFLREQRKKLQKKRQKELKSQFMDGIQLMSASLQAGYSAENALRAAVKELAKVYGEDAYAVREFRQIEVQLSMSRNLEELLLDFGRRSGVEDIRSFAEVFMTAKRSGGDLLAIIRNTVACIRLKQETVQEIETCLAGKIMEQNIMSLIPLAILAYVKLTSPEFIDCMYGNVTGAAVMSICLMVYIAAYFWGRKIVQIEV